MGHQTNIPYLKNKNIKIYLEELSKLLIKHNLGEHNILIVGGAAMALRKNSKRTTVDIDICIREQNLLYECCIEISKKFNIPTDWINADVMHSESFSYNLFDTAIHYKTYNNILNVYVASDLDILCMKLISFREKDMNDIRILIKSVRKNNIKYKDFIDNFNRLYSNTYLLSKPANTYIRYALN